MVEELKQATDDMVKALGDMGVNALAMMEAMQELTMAKQEIVLKNAEYGALKNEGQRQAFLADLLEPMQTKVRELEAQKVAINTCIQIADFKIRCAKYVIISKAGKIVA